MFELEWDHMQTHKDFKLLTDPFPQNEIDYAKTVHPRDCVDFALSKEQWSSPNHFAVMTARYPTNKCVLILRSMKKVGCRIPKLTGLESRADLADMIIMYSRLSGWDKIGENTLASLHPYSGVVVKKTVRKRKPRTTTQVT